MPHSKFRRCKGSVFLENPKNFFVFFQHFRKFLCMAFLKALLLPRKQTQKLDNMEQKTEKMPEVIIIENELREADHDLRRSLREAQVAYAELRELQDLGDIPQPNLCTADWLEKIMNRKKDALKQANFLTEAQKASQLMHFGKLHKKAQKLVEIVGGFINSIPAEQYVYDLMLVTFFLRDIDALLTESCTHVVPAEAAEHRRRIEAVRGAVHSLRSWEKEKDLKKLRLEDLLRMSPTQIAIEWVSDNLRIDHAHDNLPYVVLNRELAEQNIL